MVRILALVLFWCVVAVAATVIIWQLFLPFLNYLKELR